jgi:hypothetical protein
LRPGSSGFEKAMKAPYGLASDGRILPDGIPKNLYHLAVLLEWSEARLPGVVGALELLARRARKKGIAKELEAKYCQ